MKTRNVVIAIFTVPILLSMLLGVCLILYALYADSSSEAFDEKRIIPSEAEDYRIEDVVVRGPDTLFLFGSYDTWMNRSDTSRIIFEHRPTVLKTYDGGKSWIKSVIKERTALINYKFMDDHAFLFSLEQDSDSEFVFVSDGDFSVWDSIGGYISLEGNRVHVARVNDSVPDGLPKYRVERGPRVLSHDFVPYENNSVFARNDRNWIVGSEKNQIVFYRVEEGKAQQRLKTTYEKKKNVNIFFEDFVVKDGVFAAVMRDGHPFTFVNYYLLYSADGGREWKWERVMVDEKLYRLDIRDGKIFLAVCPLGHTFVDVLTLPIE